ncbi:Protein kinase domain-containing protein [Cinnamomum micranthum f. kanehirae]|uniref:Protein kinase domain-containing protein n=1 Tax=Cinnamomum micranthum f. kanehirae TaxID=337451 RepID=A0A443PZX8_9MAGN|nr:Protein kinase domain-containing protein [Cinnamomum micranthum f. kanehirae]
MLDHWNLFGFWPPKRAGVVVSILIVVLQFEGCFSINDEGLALLRFRMEVQSDPYGALANWDSSNSDPCQWTGIGCVDGEVRIVDLKDLSLGGTLAPELGELRNLRSLVLQKNCFFGSVPKEIAKLIMLEVLDIRSNKLNGTLPIEMGDMLSLKCLLICDNRFQGSIPTEFEKLKMLVEIQYDENLVANVKMGADHLNRKFGHWGEFKRFSSHKHGEKCYDNMAGATESYRKQKLYHLLNPARRVLLQRSSNNLAAISISSAPPEELTSIPSFGSGSFPAIVNLPHRNNKKPSSAPAPSPSFNPTPAIPIPQHPPAPVVILHEAPADNKQPLHKGYWTYIYYVLSAAAFLFVIAVVLLFLLWRKGQTAIGPWKTGLSGQLQKAFVTGVPKLNRAELETACEDFSNITATLPNCTLYKGTLSSGVEIAVASTTIKSAKDWSEQAEVHFRKKVDILSRVNHKNFVNLLGHCEEEEPFLRMMVLEYAPSSLYDHLHANGFEHLDWNARMRIIMGVAYCLQYMHHELNPPIPHSNLTSKVVYLTDDYAAKIGEFDFWKEFVAKGKISDDEGSNPSQLPVADLESNVYNFGILMLEIISGKLPYSEEQGFLVNWAAEYLNNRHTISHIVDSSLKSFKSNEFNSVCEVILECIKQDPRQRPTMKEVTTKLKEVVGISPDSANSKLSPLWWAELEILSLEAS